jgi:type IV secretion system protein VirB10
MTATGFDSLADTASGAEADPRPRVELPRRGVSAWLLVPVGLVLGIGLFAMLESRREARLVSGIERGSGSASTVLEAPPPLVIPQPYVEPSAAPAGRVGQEPLPAARSVVTRPVPTYAYPPQQTSFRPVQRPADEVYAPPRYNTGATTGANVGGSSGGGGAMVIDLTAGKGAVLNGAGDAGVASDDDAVRATIIRNRSSVVQQGVIIAAVLETPLNSDRPGMARAIVAQDVRGFDGARVLIPKGSRLIGEFKADSGSNLRRILVTWTRLIRPDGVAIRIASPAADVLGGSGIPGNVNTHFFERFTSAVLQSALLVGVNVASQLPRNGSNIYVGVPGQISQVGQDLIPDTKRPPTVKVKAGAEIAIFVAHDLDFGGTPAVR